MNVEKKHVELKKIVKDSLVIQEKKLLNLIKDRLEKGYNVYSNIDYINELIDIIVNWYEFKYPSDKIKMSEKSIISDKNNILFLVPPKHRLRKIENLSNHMGYTELMFRIPRHLHPIVECWYKDEAGSITDVGTVKIHAKNTLNIVTYKFLINMYDGYILNKEDSDLLKINSSTIEKLVERTENNQEFDIEEPKKVVLTHEYDLEIRKEIFRLISLILLFRADNFEVGYIRAKKFIEEFNKYIYNLNLSTDIIEKESSLGFEYLDKTPPYWGGYNNAREIINNMVLKLKPTEQKTIEECGLSFKTLCLLNDEKIYMKDDPNIEKVIQNWSEYYHFGQHIPHRDKRIFDKLIEQIGLIKSIEIISKVQLDIETEENKLRNENKDVKKKIYSLFFNRKNK